MEIILLLSHICVVFSVTIIMLSFFCAVIIGTNTHTFLYGMYAATLILGLIFGLIAENLPSALDVYENKTTLKYEVVNGEKIDSTVIFKTLD